MPADIITSASAYVIDDIVNMKEMRIGKTLTEEAYYYVYQANHNTDRCSKGDLL